MPETHYTTTFIEAGDRAQLHFSNEAPRFTITYSPPTELARNLNEINRLQKELGQSALELSIRNAEIHELQERVAYLEATQSQSVEPTRQAGRTAIKKEVELVNNTEALELNVSSSRNGDRTTAEPKPIIDITPDPQLLPSHRRCEQAILYLLGTPDLEVKQADAGGFLKQELGIEKITDWSNLRTKLEKLGIITITKVSPNARRSNGISLNLDGILASRDKPFITPRILSALPETSAANDKKPIEKERQPETAPPDHLSSNGKVPHQLSARVRKLLEEEPLSESSAYRERGKYAGRTRSLEPFLEHRRETRGAKRH
ncbi:MAG TPA: hypothetical protein VFN51_01630 [Candidatus Saccharimonadales bacterium]|nr:hypothetical protein [Candidatus Saccharimonadales bacterium]